MAVHAHSVFSSTHTHTHPLSISFVHIEIRRVHLFDSPCAYGYSFKKYVKKKIIKRLPNYDYNTWMGRNRHTVQTYLDSRENRICVLFNGVCIDIHIIYYVETNRIIISVFPLADGNSRCSYIYCITTKNDFFLIWLFNVPVLMCGFFYPKSVWIYCIFGVNHFNIIDRFMSICDTFTKLPLNNVQHRNNFFWEGGF